MTIGSQNYHDDVSPTGHPRFFFCGYNWAYNSTGHLLDDDGQTEACVMSNMSTISGEHLQLYITARLSPLSLTYYGVCLMNGSYAVSLHFAEIMFHDGDLGRRVFDVYIQVIFTHAFFMCP